MKKTRFKSITSCGLLWLILTPLLSVSSQNPLSTLNEVRQIKRRHRDSLLQLPGVQGVGIGREGNQFFLGVLVNPSEGQPALPTALEGVPIRRMASGPITLFQSLPVKMGSSTSNDLVNECSAGTLGFKVKDATFPNVIGYITNNHVATGGCWNGNGFNQLHPGLFDTNCIPATIIGTLDRYIRVNLDSPAPTDADAAFVSSDNTLTTREIGCGIGFPTTRVATQSEVFGQTVQKCGRTTGFTQGPVTMIFVDVNVTNFCGQTELFVDQVEVRSPGFVLPGDSGSPVVTLNKDPVGLVFAGNTFFGQFYISPLDVILSELQLQLLGGGTGGGTITVIAPNGGETLRIGRTGNIQWTSSGVTGNVKIELSRNGGASYEVLFASTPNDGVQPWTVTGPASTNCLMRISSVNDPSVQDVSDRVFTIG